MEEGHQGLQIPAQPNPTKINILCLISKNFEAIFSPITTETHTNIKLKQPFKISTKGRLIFLPLETIRLFCKIYSIIFQIDFLLFKSLLFKIDFKV